MQRIQLDGKCFLFLEEQEDKLLTATVHFTAGVWQPSVKPGFISPRAAYEWATLEVDRFLDFLERNKSGM